jgi:enoyl-CoA hydratase/carnithine racemase
MYEEIRYAVEDPTATITFNRPDRLNAWTNRMGQEIRHAVAQAEADGRVVAIVLTGAGRGFCAGADVQGLKQLSEGEAFGEEGPALEAEPGDPEMEPDFHGPHSYFTSVRKPVIAAINGPCAGLGLPMILHCDLRFASDRAVFTTAFSRRGLIAEWGISWSLPRLVGVGQALDLLFSARKIDAQEAERIGLVNRVIPHDELLKFVREYVIELAENCSPAALRVMKRQIYEDLTASFGEAQQKAVRLMAETFESPDFREGVKSFLEKRPPRFPRVSKKP